VRLAELEQVVRRCTARRAASWTPRRWPRPPA
jgi:hypothetical protein